MKWFSKWIDWDRWLWQAPVCLPPTMSAPITDLVIPKSILDTDLYKVSSIYWVEYLNSPCSHSFPCNRLFYAISQISKQHIALQTVIAQLFSPVNASSVFKQLYPVCSILYVCVILIDNFCNKTSPVCLLQKPNCNGWSAPALIWRQHILHTYPHIGTSPSRQRSNTYPSLVISWEDMSRLRYLALGRKLFSGKCPWWLASANHIFKSSSKTGTMMIRIVSTSLLTNVSTLIHETLKQTLPIRRLRPYLKLIATSANLELDVEDHTKHKTLLWKPWSVPHKKFKALAGLLVQVMWDY